jgi:antibiotic biosynthesis monooxygenase (ABM) superfamily enzyme
VFVNVVEFPPVAEGRDADFRAWFEWSTTVYAAFEGFVSRRPLEDTKVPGRYAAIVEHDSEATFMAMHLSDARQDARQRLEPLLTGSPTPHFYTVVSASTSRVRVSSPAA